MRKTKLYEQKTKILTIVALAIFSAVIFFHYYGFDYYLHSLHLRMYPAIDDVRMPLFVLAVFYTGLFFILLGKGD
jgi:hypothetical protein